MTRALPRLEPLRYARTGTLDVAYYEAGPSDGAVVLLLHGFPYEKLLAAARLTGRAVLELAAPAMTAATAHPTKGTRP